jgi:hypothetical protein
MPLPKHERMRWLELLSYVHALIYRERDAEEIPTLQETIESSVATDQFRQEIYARGKSSLATRKQMLIRLLTKKFRELPIAVSETIKATSDMAQLDAWLESIVTATLLEDVGISPSSGP